MHELAAMPHRFLTQIWDTPNAASIFYRNVEMFLLVFDVSRKEVHHARDAWREALHASMCRP
jgi:hypothetical protein